MDPWDRALMRTDGITDPAPAVQAERIVVYELNESDQILVLREPIFCPEQYRLRYLRQLTGP